MDKDLLLLQLANLTVDMDIPKFRKTDIKWLQRNLGVRNSKNENFDKAIEIITKLAKMGVSR
jgi:hypothetical protein